MSRERRRIARGLVDARISATLRDRPVAGGGWNSASMIGHSGTLLPLQRFYGQGRAMTVVEFFTISFVYGVFCLAPARIAVIVTGVVAG